MPNLTIVVDCNDQNYAREICAALRLFPDVTAVCPNIRRHARAIRQLLVSRPAAADAFAGIEADPGRVGRGRPSPDSLFASSVPLCRVVDEDFRHGMFEYALWGVLWFQRI
jgi:glyoxylate/hydroxypyruvate reductase A